ncbi:MAG: protein kinase, partial [Lentisphaeria bacterium]|nr:protein kinase [Lentisphaeria bacterium]
MDNTDKKIPSKQTAVNSVADDEVTMKNARERRKEGRFHTGDLVMDRYKILTELGQGGMGVVYKCFDEDAGIEIALKALPPELSHNTLEMEDIKENFQLVHNLHHPNIASSNTLEKDRYNGNYYLIMECCEGEDLRRWIRRKRKEGNLSLEEILPVIKQVAEALDYAHEMKIVHRDVKPGNIMIDQFGKIKVLDFGLAAQIHTSMTRVSMAYHGTSGTGPYMAPEQWEGQAQGAMADQYALAVIAYEMLAGHTPFESTDAAVLREAVLKSEVKPLENVPKTVDNAIQRALSKDSSARFASCSDFAAALGGKKFKSIKTQINPADKFKWMAAVLVFIFLCIIGSEYYFLDKQKKEQLLQARLAAEKAEREHREQLLAEQRKKEAERIAAEEAEKALLKKKLAEAEKIRQELLARQAEEKLDNENALLKVELKEKIAIIKQNNYDREKSFSQKISDMNIAYCTAAEAKLPITANKKYKEAKRLADWILLHGELCKNTNRFKALAEKRKIEAEECEPLVYAKVLYNEAMTAYRTAVTFYGNRKFAEAQKNFEVAVKGFENTRNTAIDGKLQFLIMEAKKAEQTKNWGELKKYAEKMRSYNPILAEQFTNRAEKELRILAVQKELIAARNARKQKIWRNVYNNAVKILKIDSANIEAQKLKTEAENNFEPTLEIIATVDGKRVPAIVRFGNKDFKTLNYNFDKL